MDLNIPDIGLTGLAGFVVIAAAIVGLMRGLVRMLFVFVALNIGCLGAYWGILRGGSMLGGFFVDSPSWLPAAVGFSVGLALFIITRAIFGMVLTPIKVVEGRRQNHPLPGGLVGILTGLVFIWFAASATRYLGTLAEIDRLDRSITKEKIEDVPVSPFITMKALLDSSAPGRLHSKVDFLNDPARAQLAKLKIIAREQHAVNKCAGSNRAVYDAFAHKDVREVLQSSPELEMVYLREKSWSHLLATRRFRELARKKEVREVLADASFEEALGIAPPPPRADDDEEKEKTAGK